MIDNKTGIRSTNKRHWCDNWIQSYQQIIQEDPTFFSNLLSNNPRLIFWVNDNCLLYLIDMFSREIEVGLINEECVFSMSKEWFIMHYKLVPQLKQHFIKRPGLWFYIFRYDQKKINPRTGEVSKELKEAFEIQDYWGISHATVSKLGNAYKLVEL